MGLLQSIREGKYDENLDSIAAAVMARKKVMGYRLFDELEVGDEVVFLNTVRPTYLRGEKGKVTGFRRSKILIQLARPSGRFMGGIVAHPQSIKKVVTHEAEANG